MATALQRLSEEDPTFKVYTHEDTGQTIIAGMGELHLEIIRDRMFREFKVDANAGKPQIAYRETITGGAHGVGIAYDCKKIVHTIASAMCIGLQSEAALAFAAHNSRAGGASTGALRAVALQHLSIVIEGAFTMSARLNGLAAAVGAASSLSRIPSRVTAHRAVRGATGARRNAVEAILP